MQVIVNLISNAVKFSDKENGWVQNRGAARGRRPSASTSATTASASQEGPHQDLRALPAGRQHAHREACRNRARPADLAARFFAISTARSGSRARSATARLFRSAFRRRVRIQRSSRRQARPPSRPSNARGRSNGLHACARVREIGFQRLAHIHDASQAFDKLILLALAQPCFG